MSDEKRKQKREAVINKFERASYINAGYALAIVEINALYKEEAGEGCLEKLAKRMLL